MFSNPRGTQDILPAEWPAWEVVIRHAEEVARLYGYQRIETPTFGPTRLFTRTTGEGTDIVDKEMYTFRDREGDELTLRPEGTAPIMRAYLQHGMHKLPQPVKLFYLERIYRHDRPQRGRLREHHQFGAEAIGVEDPYLDVEVIALLAEFYRRIGLRDLTLAINSIGDATCRPRYVQTLVSYLRQHEAELCPTCRERIERNPLRVLDCKQASCQPVLARAPRLLDYLCERCQSHWERVRHGLNVLGIPYEIDPRLVRGLDYYTDTVFEFRPQTEGAQAVVGGGGRYDALSRAMGGPPVPGVGFGTGIERLILNLRDQGVQFPPEPRPEVYVAHLGAEAEDAALALGSRLRQADIATELTYGNRSLKAQMKAANARGARYAAILGEDEVRNGQVTLRWLESGEQRTMPLDEVESALRTQASTGA